MVLTLCCDGASCLSFLLFCLLNSYYLFYLIIASETVSLFYHVSSIMVCCVCELVYYSLSVRVLWSFGHLW